MTTGARAGTAGCSDGFSRSFCRALGSRWEAVQRRDGQEEGEAGGHTEASKRERRGKGQVREGGGAGGGREARPPGLW